MTSNLSQTLTTYTPNRPYCTHDLTDGLRIRGREQALKLPYLQVNPPHLRFWMTHDIDREGAAFAWHDADLPSPSWVAITPENRHAHLAWGLSAPVLIGDTARAAPIRYLCAIEAAFRVRLQADTAYNGLITKNPLHDRWLLLHSPDLPVKLYELSELADYVDLQMFIPKVGAKVEEIGLGRNVTVFDWLRFWAYNSVRAYRGCRTGFVYWQTECYDKALQRNGDFIYPLNSREVWHIANSVARFCWREDAKHALAFSKRQAFRGQKGGIAKGKAYEDKATRAHLMAATGKTNQEIAASLGVHRNTISNWLKSYAQIA